MKFYFIVLIFALFSFRIPVDSQSAEKFTRLHDSIQFVNPGMDTIDICIDIEYPTGGDLKSENMRKYILSCLLYPNNDSICWLPIEEQKDSILSRLYMTHHKAGRLIRAKNHIAPKCIQDFEQITMVPSGLSAISTMHWIEETKISSGEIFSNLVNYSSYYSINNYTGKSLSLDDIVKKNKYKKVLSLLRRRIKDYCKCNNKEYCSNDYTDLTLTVCVSIIEKNLHCQWLIGCPSDFIFDIPLSDIQKYLSIDLN